MAMTAPAMASTVTVAASNANSSVLRHGFPPYSTCSWKRLSSIGRRKAGIRNAARASSPTSDTKMVGTACTPQIAPTNQMSQIGSPLLWIGVGIGLSAWFSVMATKLKRYAIHRAFKSLKGEDSESNYGQFDATAFAPGGSNAVSIPEVEANAPSVDETAASSTNSD